MGITPFKKTNNRAVLGFLLPFVAMGSACGVVLWNRAYGLPFPVWLPILVLVPVLLAWGLFFSITSIPRIEDLGDKDYAYSGLVLNLFLVLLLFSSILYYLVRIHPGT
ncbi:MAG: hypothetical protein K9M82_00035 [Deltaproteobacteria bacterium]|nr:hypothetical protein [Deltaproteobacteria bacterium]